jgi:multiple sugar transport system permease protein
VTVEGTAGAPARPSAAVLTPRSRLARKRARTAYIFLAAPVAFFVALFFYPLVQELITSFYTGPQADDFVGTRNYTDAFSDDAVRHAFAVTLEYAAVTVVISIAVGLGLAVILNQKLRGRVIFRGILLVPYLTSMAIVGLLWRNILDPQVGILNRVLNELGLPQQTWLNTHPLATLVFIAVWQHVGYTTLLFVAGMQGIPESYYEAARVDGATARQRFRSITLPLLTPTTLFLSVIGVISSLQEFSLPFLVTNGGPGEATDLYIFRVYNVAFTFRNFGYSSALSYLMLIVILVLSIIQLRVGRRDYGE